MDKMEKIQPAEVKLKSGKHLNVAQLGSGPAILFLHGFPRTWYMWRHQIHALSKDYRCIAPDLRGYGGSSAPGDWTSYTTVQIINDLVALLDELKIVDKIFLVGHDWGAIVAWHFCLLRPDRIKAMVNTSVAFMLRDQSVSPVPAFRAEYGDGLHMCRFQDPEKANREITSCDPENVVRGFYDWFGKPTPQVLQPDEGFDDLFRIHYDVPSFLTDDDIKVYAKAFSQTGYIGGINYYRAIEQTWELMGAYEGLKITTPVYFVVGDKDLAYNFMDTKEYINNGGLQRDVPNVEIEIWKNVTHFLPEEKPDKLNKLIHDYFGLFN